MNSTETIFKSSWKCPSNIALVKYWGKKGFQLPSNASISFTLNNCHTETTLLAKEKTSDMRVIQVAVDGSSKPEFLPKIEKFFRAISERFPVLNGFDFEISTSNTFPHSSGIASSASGMGALALCVIDFLVEQGEEIVNLRELASDLARIGSGSASRSLYGGLVMWGEHDKYDGSSDNFAIPFENYHPVFGSFHDDILIVHEGSKSVSSSAGHGLLEGHPFADQRFETAYNNMISIKEILISGDLDRFVELVEAEALMLHALMMTSSPSYILMKPETLAIIQAIREDRAEKGHHICFTLDAGANVHMLYPDKDSDAATELIHNNLVEYCANGRYIRDIIGPGPIKVND